VRTACECAAAHAVVKCVRVRSVELIVSRHMTLRCGGVCVAVCLFSLKVIVLHGVRLW
jgi:hypothetical protein